MLKKENRISLNKDFDRVFKTGQSFYCQVLGVKVAKNKLLTSRFGILISTKISKKAVIRNRFKRQLREIIQKNLLELKSGYDVVLIVLPPILDKKFEELETFLGLSFKKLKLYK
ncbi:MAG: ribonuclease P protein component [Patescibacteria group bacterium]